MRKKTISQARKLVSIGLLTVISIGGLHAADPLVLEAENYISEQKGYNKDNVEVGSEVKYSGDKYVGITGGSGDIPLEFTITEVGEYSFVLYYHGYSNEWNHSNIHYNLYGSSGYDADASDQGKLTGNKIDDIGEYGTRSFDYTFTDAGTYYIALYGNAGTVFDKVDILKDGNSFQTVEAEAYAEGKGYKSGDDFIFSIEDAVYTFSGGEYLLIDGDHGEATVPLDITIPGTYTIKLFYQGFDDSNNFYNIYGEAGYIDPSIQADEGKLEGGEIDDMWDYGSESIQYTFETAGTYYVALYGNPGTKFDKVELTLETALSIFNGAAETISITYNNGILINAEGNFEYALYNSVGSLVGQGESAGSATIDVQSLPAGIYIVNVNAGGKQFAKKVCIF